MNKKWLLIIEKNKNGFWNMSADEELLSFENPILRIYSFSPYCITLGYSMNEKEINYNFCKENKIDITRRITGGKAVLHTKDITFSLQLPFLYFDNSIIEAYKKTAIILSEVFKSFNILVKYFSDKKEFNSPLCFLENSFYEISYKDKKICGFAQKKAKNKILQQCTIPFEIDYKLLLGCFNFKKEEQEMINQKITSLKEIKRDIVENDFIESIIKAFEKYYKINFFKIEFNSQQINNIINRMNNKYTKKCWIKKND